MEYQQLGASNLHVSQISFGCMSLRHNHNENAEQIRHAFDQGINFFDTADLYDKGWNEESVGKAVKNFRKEVVLATKVGNEWKPDGSGWMWNPTKAYILKAVEESLRRLQTDYIDLYQLHGGTIEDPIDETIEAFEQLRAEGKIRYYGISSIRPNTIRKYVERSNMTSVMMQYSLLDRRPEETCLNLLAENNISVLTRGTLAKGLLIDKPPRDYLGYDQAEVEKIQRALHATGSPMAAALHYVFKKPAVATAVVGIRTRRQLEEVLGGYQEEMKPTILQALGEVLAPNFYDQHR